MYDLNCTNVLNLKNTCRGCLKMGDDVRAMTTDEENAYRQFVKESNLSSSLYICLFCGHLINKFSKFVLQCHGANKILNGFLEKDTKSQIYFPPLLLSYNLTVSHLQTLDVLEKEELNETTIFEDDNTFDDEDVPLVMLKKEDTEVEKGRKRKKKVRNREVKDHQRTDTPIKIEDTKPDDTSETGSSRKAKSKKPKKELREGFSSRMVQETDEYVVIKLTKEQVRAELAARASDASFQRALFKCHACVKGFNFDDVLRTHLQKHSLENGPLQCDICTQYCPSVVSLRGHMKSHTTRYRCKVCGCTRQSRQHLLEHHAEHTRAAPRYECSQCEFVTTKRTSMQRHVKSHRPLERHACHRCGKLFKSLETLRVHTMRHERGARPQCDACGRLFVYPSLLQRHVQAVHERRDYYCVECDREFKSRENLRLHFKKAKKHRDASSNQYECSQCPERFASTAARAAHSARAHGRRAPPRDAPARTKLASGQGDRTHARKSVVAAPMHADCDQDEHDAACKKIEDSIMPEVSQTTLLES